MAGDEWRHQEKSKPPSPLFCVNVASKGLSICVSRLESTVARGSQVLILRDLGNVGDAGILELRDGARSFGSRCSLRIRILRRMLSGLQMEAERGRPVLESLGGVGRREF